MKISNCVASYPQLWKPKAFGGGDGKKTYEITGILDKVKDKDQIAAIEAEIKAFAKENKLEGARSFLHDGAEPKKDGSPRTAEEGYGPGKVFFRAKSDDTHRPSVIDRNKAPLTEADDKIYGGAIVNIWISLWGQNHPKYGRMIGANVLGVQRVGDGKRLGGKSIDLDQEAENLEELEESVL